MGYRAFASLTLKVKGIEVELDCYGIITSGGSNRWGSDEPEWQDCADIEIEHNGKEVSDKVYLEIMKKHDTRIQEQLIRNGY